MENEPKEPYPIESPEKEYGRSVEVHAVFMRHGERADSGALTEEGIKQAEAFGQSLENKDAVKVYSSPIQRAIETAEQVIKTAPHDKKLKTRIRSELEIPSISQQFLEKLKEMETQNPDTSTEFYLSFGKERPDKETASPHEIAEMMAYILTKYFKIAEKLKSGSNIDLVNVTHQGLPEALLKEVLIQQEEEKIKIGFEKLEEIGGPLKLAESMEFRIKTDEQGKKTVQLYLRGKIFDLDLSRVNELSRAYAEKQKV